MSLRNSAARLDSAAQVHLTAAEANQPRSRPNLPSSPTHSGQFLQMPWQATARASCLQTGATSLESVPLLSSKLCPQPVRMYDNFSYCIMLHLLLTGLVTVCCRPEISKAATPFRKTKIVCTIGPTSCTRENLFRLADQGMNVARSEPRLALTSQHAACTQCPPFVFSGTALAVRHFRQHSHMLLPAKGL